MALHNMEQIPHKYHSTNCTFFVLQQSIRFVITGRTQQPFQRNFSTSIIKQVFKTIIGSMGGSWLAVALGKPKIDDLIFHALLRGKYITITEY